MVTSFAWQEERMTAKELGSLKAEGGEMVGRDEGSRRRPPSLGGE